MEIRNIVRAIVYDIVKGDYIYLLLKAKKDYWQNPQGGINEGESEIEALVREVREETGISIDGVSNWIRDSLEYQTERKGVLINSNVVSYAVRVDSSKKVKLSEEEGHTEYRWVNYEEALKLLTTYPEQG